MAVVGVEDLREYMSDIDLTEAQEAAAVTVIAGVQKQLETYLKRPVEVNEEPITETVWVDSLGLIVPRRTPVVEVTSLLSVPGGEVLGWALNERGMINVGFGYFPLSAPLTLSYRGGWDGPNLPDIKLAILEVVSRQMTNRHDDTFSVTDLEHRAPAPPEIGWKPEELAALDFYKRRVVA